MRDVNNLLKRLRGIQRQVAKHMILEIDQSRFKEKTFKVDDLVSMFYTDRSTISFTFDKLVISEIVRCQKKERGIYLFKRSNWQSFDEVAKIFKAEDEDND